ncbi:MULTISPECIES: hypothetical protein [unclassified Streptomyces]|uniref:hypothetical protein n=1 Tax=unclassified Streptomyces TaxID=2593676 RepID=UPI0011E67C67|nr:hypothetical protein [Streptomyces sp. sk2.1]TXS67673.1 hypothetical protein EAO76_33350 [Streptomyces sp. sk2.1]
MSDARQPELPSKEQRAQDQQRIQGQLIATDINRRAQSVMDAFIAGSSGPSGRTSFEGHELNAMIDLIESSDPEHLEEAGAALLKARTAIKSAAKELGDFIKGVDWEGESGTAFRDWGNGLVAHAVKLGDFAEAAGTQITVAGTGLASVRKSLPPRDSRLVRKSVEEIETPKRIDGNPEYAEAVKVEKDRQEAINQANRLASYYAVSAETLAAQEPPRFEKKLGITMPKPHGFRENGEIGDPSTSFGAVGNKTTRGAPGSVDAAGADFLEAPSNRAEIEALGTAPAPGGVISTEIDSVTVPRAPGTAPETPPMLSNANSTDPITGPILPVADGFVNPVTESSRRPPTPTGLPRTIGQPGSSGPVNSGPVANGRTGTPVGRPPMLGGGPAPGAPGRPGGSGNQSPFVSRPGVTGGGPAASAPRQSGPPVGRANGIVGGTPQRTVPGVGASGKGRGVPRGAVVGADGTSRAPRPSGRGTPSSNGVVGAPRRGVPGMGSGAKGFTNGGKGLVREPLGRGESENEDQDGGTLRPDYLAEGRATREAGRPGTAPPVIE